MDINRKDIEAHVSMAASGVSFVAGSILLTNGWADMEWIKTQGIAGQVAYEQQWQQASSDVELGLILILLGLVFAISGAANYLVAKLDKMSG